MCHGRANGHADVLVFVFVGVCIAHLTSDTFVFQPDITDKAFAPNNISMHAVFGVQNNRAATQEHLSPISHYSTFHYSPLAPCGCSH